MEKTLLTIEETSSVLKLLGDKTRLSMIGLLLQNDYCVCEFVELFQMSQPSISQHLRKLKDIGLVGETRKGQWIIYSINSKSEYFHLVKDVISHVPDQREKLKWLEEQGKRISCE
jgi:ArsR family transcriptional regulator, arsenate/arsenite/antimonite-responsive transcriptional repressor